MYTFEEYADIHMIYGEARGNARAAARLYRERFPERRHPHYSTFIDTHRRIRETGTVEANKRSCGVTRRVRGEENVQEVLDRFADNPSTSTRAICHELNLSQSSVWRIAHEEKLYPFHLQKVMAITAEDYAPRMTFCDWFLHRYQRALDFPRYVLFTDEAFFSRNGYFNSKNSHVWDTENPHAISTRGHQHKFGVNIWAGIVENKIIGPYLLPARLTGHIYEVFLRTVLPELLEEVPLLVRQRMWYQCDGAPAHFSLSVRQYLDETYPNRWIGRGGPVDWPARSPDLTPLDFGLWGHIKSLVYSSPVESEEDLLARILAACQTIQDMPGIFENMRRSLVRRCHLCINNRGGIFEQFL